MAPSPGMFIWWSCWLVARAALGLRGPYAAEPGDTTAAALPGLLCPALPCIGRRARRQLTRHLRLLWMPCVGNQPPQHNPWHLQPVRARFPCRRPRRLFERQRTTWTAAPCMPALVGVAPPRLLHRRGRSPWSGSPWHACGCRQCSP